MIFTYINSSRFSFSTSSAIDIIIIPTLQMKENEGLEIQTAAQFQLQFEQKIYLDWEV